MSLQKYILTVVAKDAPGIIQSVSQAVQAAGGNWLESSLTRLGGQFAGIVRVELNVEGIQNLKTNLAKIANQGIIVTIHDAIAHNKTKNDVLVDNVKAPTADNVSTQTVRLKIEANDRPGIIEEITTALASIQINIEDITTTCESASMAGYSLFVADMQIALPNNMDLESLESVLEAVSDDLMVETATES